MKVIHLLDTLNRGGAEILELDILKNAGANDLDLTFAAMNGGVLEEEFRAAGAFFLKPRRKLPVDPFVIKQLRRLIKKTSAELIHTHQAVEGIHAYLAALGTKTKTVLSHHGFVSDNKNRKTLKFLIPRVSQNVVVSQALKNWYSEKAGLNLNYNLSIIYNGVDENRLKVSGNDLRKELNITGDALLFGMVSNFYVDPRKDQITLCRALPHIFREIPNSHCVFVGKTESGAESKVAECAEICRKNRISDRVHFLGLRTDIPQILHSLDVFVLSSLHEGMPIAVLEAMLANVPCVLSDIEPLAEVSENGKYTEIFPVQNAEILAQRVIKLLQNADYRKELSEKTGKYARENFSIEAHIESLKNLYAKLITE